MTERICANENSGRGWMREGVELSMMVLCYWWWKEVTDTRCANKKWRQGWMREGVELSMMVLSNWWWKEVTDRKCANKKWRPWWMREGVFINDTFKLLVVEGEGKRCVLARIKTVMEGRWSYQ